MELTIHEALCGQTPDVSVLMYFVFWEKCLIKTYQTDVFWEKCLIKNYQTDGKNFPSQSDEIVVRFVGYSNTVGHSLTFKVYNEKTNALLFRSCVKKMNNERDINRKADDDSGDLPDIDGIDES